MKFFQEVARSEQPRTRTQRQRNEHQRCQPHFYPVVKDGSPPDPCTPRKRKTKHSSNPPVEHHVGWVMDVREHRQRTTSTRLVFFLVETKTFAQARTSAVQIAFGVETVLQKFIGLSSLMEFCHFSIFFIPSPYTRSQGTFLTSFGDFFFKFGIVS